MMAGFAVNQWPQKIKIHLIADNIGRTRNQAAGFGAAPAGLSRADANNRQTSLRPTGLHRVDIIAGKPDGTGGSF